MQWYIGGGGGVVTLHNALHCGLAGLKFKYLQSVGGQLHVGEVVSVSFMKKSLIDPSAIKVTFFSGYMVNILQASNLIYIHVRKVLI